MEELESPLARLTPLAPRVSLAPLGPAGTAASAPRQLAPAATAAHAAKAKPDARPMRLILGAGGLAAFSAIATAIILPPAPVAAPQGGSSAGQGAPAAIQRPIQYIQLQPGQTAPPGATVIDATAPQPVTVVTTVPAPAQKPIIIKTTQSGKVVK